MRARARARLRDRVRIRARVSIVTSSSLASPRTFCSMPRTRMGKSIMSTWLYLRSPHLGEG